MNWKVVETIYLKEGLDALRDRRTLLSTIIIPTVLMPLLTIGLGGAAAKLVSRARAEVPRVMVVGAEDSPGVLGQLKSSGKFRIERASDGWRALVADKQVRAVVEIPAGFERALEAGAAPAVTLYDYEGELRSEFAVEQLRNFFAGLRDRAAARLLTARGVPETLARPFDIKQTNVAPPEKVGGNQLGGIVPYFIVLLCYVGAMYPATDLIAGEKERSTLEPLLCSPAGRLEIVTGKFLMVLTGSVGALTCSVVSMGVTAVIAAGLIGAPMAAAAGATSATVPSIDPTGAVGVLALIVPVAVLFSAVLLAISAFARTAKEAQAYMAPLVAVVLLPAAAGMLPGVDLNLTLALVPILNISLICKEMLSGVWHWGYIALIFGSTAAYAAVALGWAAWMFRRESVLFRT